MKLEFWEDYSIEDDRHSEEDADGSCLPSGVEVENFSKHNAIIMWIIGFLLKLQKRHYLSDSALEMLLKFLSMLFVVIGKFSSFAAGISAIFPS